jgi:hypothetical protein
LFAGNVGQLASSRFCNNQCSAWNCLDSEGVEKGRGARCDFMVTQITAMGVIG